jgi:hypothetical protein
VLRTNRYSGLEVRVIIFSSGESDLPRPTPRVRSDRIPIA